MRRVRPAQPTHGNLRRAKFIEHTPDGEAWRGFAAAKELTEIGPGIVLVSLPGHTRGHAAIAVNTGPKWILHAGDAFYHHSQIDGTGKNPLALAGMEALIAFNRKQVQDNHRRLTELYNQADTDLSIVCAHDPTMLRRCQSDT